MKHLLTEIGAVVKALFVFAYWILFLMWVTDPEPREDKKP